MTHIDVITVFISAALAAFCGVFVLCHRKLSVAQISYGVGMVLLATESVFSGLSLSAQSLDSAVHWQNFRCGVLAFLPGVWVLFSACYSRGDFKINLVRQWPLLAGFVVIPLGMLLLFYDEMVLTPDPAVNGPDALAVLSRPGSILHIVWVAAIAVILLNLERTFRASVGTLRWRIKYILLGQGVWLVMRLYISTQFILFRAVTPGMETLKAGSLIVGCLLMARSLFREGVFGVELFPSGAVLYRSLAAILVGLYLVLVGVLASLAGVLGGVGSLPFRSLIVLVALALLAMLLGSDRAKQELRVWVSRHFRRPIFDYRRIWLDFAEHTAKRTDANAVCAKVAEWVADTCELLSASIWLTEENRPGFRRVASTAQVPQASSVTASSPEETACLVAGLKGRTEPFLLNVPEGEWHRILADWHPDQFKQPGGRLCVPIASRGELLGFMVLGDRVKGLPFGPDELELLKCIAEHLASNLLNIRLANRLTRAKELEAFQSFSAFLVHDLKNTSSSLGLMLQNLPRHFENPAFREDAIRTVERGVGRINELIQRLNQLRHAPQLKRVEASLNTTVEKSLENLPPMPGLTLKKDLQTLPPLQFDPEQMQQVIQNLLLNAADAVSGHGEIRISTSAAKDLVSLTVTDNGCGMTSEFIERQLFQPFQTTKKNGLGIGMFQCKTVVEAHDGRIEVESRPGAGTTFRVLLPTISPL